MRIWYDREHVVSHSLDRLGSGRFASRSGRVDKTTAWRYSFRTDLGYARKWFLQLGGILSPMANLALPIRQRSWLSVLRLATLLFLVGFLLV